jgi:hypothetical protein
MNANSKKIRKIEKKEKQMFKRIKKAEKRPKRNATKVTTIGKALRGVGRIAGNYFGSGSLGEAAGAGISRIFGQGDYVMPQRNSLMSSGVPSFSPLTSGFRIRHREYIQDIQSSISFASQTFQLNPGLTTLFPWLASVAQNFEQYKIHGAVVYLNTTSATAVSSTNTALGLWGVVTQYDPTEPDFESKQQCENYVGCQTAVPSCSLIHGIECKPNVNVLDRYYVRSGAILSAEDLKFYDLGKIQVFTQGSQAVATIGEMWISYDIEFMKPRLPTNQNNYVATSRFFNNTTVSSSVPLGVSTPETAGSTLGSSVDSTGTIITLPANAPNTNYILVVRHSSSGTATTTTPTVAVGGSLQLKQYFSNNTTSNVSAPQSGVLLVNRFIQLVTFSKVTGTIGTLTVGNYTLGTTPLVDVVITQMSSGFAFLDKSRSNRLGMDEIDMLRVMMRKHNVQNVKLSEIEEVKAEEPDYEESDLDDTSYTELTRKVGKGSHPVETKRLVIGTRK